MTNKELEEELDFSLEDQELSEEDKELLNTIYDRLDTFEQMNRPYHEEASKCRQILNMEDPDQDDLETLMEHGKETLQLQTLKSTINNVVADQMLSMPEAKVLPETPENQAAADDLQDILHYITYCANNYEDVHYQRCEDFYCTGTAITQIAWDQDMNYGKGDVAIINWPVESFIWDYTADNLDDCRAVMKVSWHPLSWFRSHWPEEGKFVGAEDGSHNNVGMNPDEGPNDEQRALLIEYWWREYNAKTRRYTINVAYAAGNALLEKQTDVYAHGMYPFVIDVHDRIKGCLVGTGLVKELAPMMRYINRYAAYCDMNARKSSHGRLLVKRSAGIDKEALSDWRVEIIEGDSIQPDSVVWMANQPFSNAITQLLSMMQSDLKADSGANQFTRGETTGGIVSGKAINSLIQAGGKISSMRTEQLKFGSKKMDDQKAWLVSQFYDDGRSLMITGRRPVKVDMKKIFGKKKGSINPPPYTVQIEISSRDPQRIANQNQMLMEAYTMSAQAGQNFPLSALFRMLNLDGKDRLLPVIQENEQYMEQLMALQQQVAQMSEQMNGLQIQNQNLKKTNMESANTIATMAARRKPEESAMVTGAQNNFGMQTGSPLPT